MVSVSQGAGAGWAGPNGSAEGSLSAPLTQLAAAAAHLATQDASRGVALTPLDEGVWQAEASSLMQGAEGSWGAPVDPLSCDVPGAVLPLTQAVGGYEWGLPGASQGPDGLSQSQPFWPGA